MSVSICVCVCVSVHSVLESEVVDLRLCLKSADKELAEVKTSKRQDQKFHDEKVMDCMLKVEPSVA